MKLEDVIDEDDLRQLNRARGYHFFSKNTMKFFASRVLSYIYHVDNSLGHFVIFLTSEKKCFDDPTRVYHVRTMNVEGRVMTGKVEFSDRRTAIRYAEHLEDQQKILQQMQGEE